MRIRKGFAAVAAMIFAAPAAAQSFNIDFGVAGTGPDATYGAAANQAGAWNIITSATAANVALNNLSGAATGVTLSLNGGTMLNLTTSAPNGAATPAGSNAERLLDDLWDPGANVGGIAGTITINNLAAGQYAFYTYGVAPDSGTFTTGINVVGSPEGQLNVSGTLPNPFNDAYSPGLTHQVHTLTLGGPSQVLINISVVTSFASVNGLQIVQIPAPGSLTLLAAAGLICGRRRRR